VNRGSIRRLPPTSCCRRIPRQHDVGGNRLMEPRFTLLRRKSFFLKSRGRILVCLPNYVRKNSIVRQDFGWKREQEHRGIGDEKTAGRSNQIWQRTPRERTNVHLADPAQARGESSIGAMTVRKNAQPPAVEQLRSDAPFGRRLQNPVLVVRQERIHLGVVLLGLE